MRTTTDTTSTDRELQEAAGRGDRAAFAELHRRHAPLAWRLALAVTGDPDRATTAVADATGHLFTALRAGRFQAQPHGTALAAAARNAALDLRRGDITTMPTVPDAADAHLVAAFHALPERWRSVLWLRDAEALVAGAVAPLVELDGEAVDQLAVRARRGLRERYVRTLVASCSARNCTRAVSRLGALEDGTLNDKDVANLERHLRLCEACRDRRERVAGLHAALPALALALPADLDDRAAAAWGSALASSTHTGLSPRTEKVLAGASAFAAALGVLGAALFGAGGGDEPTASPLAPLVADIETPRPVDLSDLLAPIASPTPPARPSVSAADAAATRAGRTAAAPSAGSEFAAPAAPQAPAAGDSGGEIAAERPSGPLGDAPINVDVEEGVTVGPVTVDPTPDGGPVLDVKAPEPVAPVTQPIVDAANQVATPVAEGAEPVVEADPVVEATQPVTDAIATVAGSLGGL